MFSLTTHAPTRRDRSSRRAPRWAPGLFALVLLLAAWPAAAQDIPVAPRGRAQPARPAQTRGDTVPEASAARREVVQDSIIDQLLRLEGYVPVEYQGDSAEFRNAERTLRLRGNPVVTRAGTTLRAADSIVYRERSDFVEVYGSPQVTGEGQDITGDVMFYDLAARRASVRGARTTLEEGATWFVEGNVTSEEQGQRVYATGSTFTTDDREVPAYYFKADRIKVLRNRVLVGRPAYLYFRNVPVFVLPFIFQDLGRGRRSGFLIPDFEITDIIRTDAPGRGQRGTGRQIGNIGYYWAINEYMGAQVAFEWRSQSWMSLAGGYQFNWRRQFLNGNLNFQHFWREAGRTSLNLNGGGSWAPNERTTMNLGLNYSSQTTFERNRSIDPYRQTSDISSTFSLNRRMDWGQVATGAELRQSIATGDNTLRSRFSLNPETFTLFSAGDAEPRWFNDAAVTLGADFSYDQTTRDEGLARRLADERGLGGNVNGGVRFGPIGVNGGLRYSRESRDALAAIDSLDAEPGTTTGLGFRPGLERQSVDWNASTAYEFRLFGSTRLSPSVSLGQRFLNRDTTFHPDSAVSPVERQAYGRFVAETPRLTFGAGLQTELFGFFPGFGDYSAIRHHVKPGVSYRYSPAIDQDSVQVLVFGRNEAREANEITLDFDQTFEAKLRAPRRSGRGDPVEGAGTGNPEDASAGNPGAQTDSTGAALGRNEGNAQADSIGQQEGGGGGQSPDGARKVTLLAIDTGVLAYSFVPTDDFGTRFRTDDLSNTLRSDLFGGFNVTVGHDLFQEQRVQDDNDGRTSVSTRRGRFDPFLTTLQTSLSFGANSALFRWMGFARADEGDRATERGQTPADEGQAPIDPPGAQTQTGRAMPTGGGAWNAQMSYSLRRRRPSPLDSIPSRQSLDNQQLSGSVSFFPSRNWAVSWRTDYSITQGEFGTHMLNLKRDLYRWQANFDFIRAPNGNTSFSFSVHLSDLPDLKADYRRQNLGSDRPQGTRVGQP